MWPFPWNVLGFLIFVIPFWLFYRAIKSAQKRGRSFYDIENHPPPGAL
jgi:hypothetical protein